MAVCAQAYLPSGRAGRRGHGQPCQADGAASPPPVRRQVVRIAAKSRPGPGPLVMRVPPGSDGVVWPGRPVPGRRMPGAWVPVSLVQAAA